MSKSPRALMYEHTIGSCGWLEAFDNGERLDYFTFRRNLDLMLRLSDRVAQGRAYGNLGNTHYLLGNFRKAITFHEQRLKFASEFRDRAAERRAYSNLGNCHVFLGEFDRAAEYYRRTLELAQQLNDRAVEAQACYSLGELQSRPTLDLKRQCSPVLMFSLNF